MLNLCDAWQVPGWILKLQAASLLVKAQHGITAFSLAASADLASASSKKPSAHQTGAQKTVFFLPYKTELHAIETFMLAQGQHTAA